MMFRSAAVSRSTLLAPQRPRRQSLDLIGGFIHGGLRVTAHRRHLAQALALNPGQCRSARYRRRLGIFVVPKDMTVGMDQKHIFQRIPARHLGLADTLDCHAPVGKLDAFIFTCGV